MNLLFTLRKKGNYLNSHEHAKPVRSGTENTNYLPCKHCLGYYSSKNLWRHIKQCDANPSKGASAKNAKSEAQNFLIRTLKVDDHLKDEVFPRMRADQISLTAKKDKLICAFASRYLKIHRDKHFVLVASRKMRELARLLIEMQKLDTSLNDLFQCLKPEHYDKLVSATKAASKYDYEKRSYQSPTFALNMGTVLKQCCDIALMHVLKRSVLFPTISSANVEANLKSLIDLIASNWKFDISNQAACDLNIKKWNKVTLIPLASDLKLLKDCLIQKAESALSDLKKNNHDAKAYNTLLETVYCRILLLNRRRPGELQRLFTSTYMSAMQNQSSQTYEEFSEAVSETEKILITKFKRIVIKGKRGRGVPVLISKDVQEHVDVMLEYRNHVFRKTNLYLFGNPNTGQPITGYKILKKYVTLCGAKNPDALTCTRLRKHLATLTQLFNLTENDMEQLASFMGHTLGIHRSSYRLPDDVYQTSKISKLLILMEKGEAGQFKGKTLDEINLNLEENVLEEPEENLLEEPEETTEILADDNIIPNDDEQNKICSGIATNYRKKMLPKKKISPKRKIQRTPWTQDQKNIVTNYFKTHITQKKPPKQAECEELISKNSAILRNKDWLKIKVFVQNIYRKK